MLLPSHTARQVRGFECRDFGFDTRIVTALLSTENIFLECCGGLSLLLLVTLRGQPVALLVEMGTAPPIVPGKEMLRPMNRFSHRHVYSDNCSCPIEEHNRTMALIC